MPPDYSPAGLADAAGVDPWALYRRLADGRPDAIRGAGAGFRGAGTAAGAALNRGRDADLTVANAYSNDGTPVFDAATSTAQSSRNLADGGERMEEIARALYEVADALTEHTGTAAGHLRTLSADVQHVIDARNAYFARTPALTEAEVSAAEERYHRMAADATAAAAKRIDTEITAYDQVAANRASRIDEFGYHATVTSGGGGAGRDRGFLGGLADLGAGAVNSAASLGNALLHNPLAVGGLVVGAAGFAAGSAVALAGGTVSLSGVGITVGVPAAGAGVALAGTGGALVLASAADLSAAASGADRVDPVATGGDQPLTIEEKRAAARDALLDEEGSPPGVQGSRREYREVGRGEFDEIQDSIRSRLGDPDRTVEIPGKGTIEVWEIGPGENITYRTFSRSGSLGVSGDETLDVNNVGGLDEVHRLHIQGD